MAERIRFARAVLTVMLVSTVLRSLVSTLSVMALMTYEAPDDAPSLAVVPHKDEVHSLAGNAGGTQGGQLHAQVHREHQDLHDHKEHREHQDEHVAGHGHLPPMEPHLARMSEEQQRKWRQAGCGCGHRPVCHTSQLIPNTTQANLTLPTCSDLGMIAETVETDKFSSLRQVFCRKTWWEYDPPCDCNRTSGSFPHKDSSKDTVSDPRLLKVSRNTQESRLPCLLEDDDQAGVHRGGVRPQQQRKPSCRHAVNNCIDRCKGLHCNTHCTYLGTCKVAVDCALGPGDNASKCAPQCGGYLHCERVCANALPCPANCTCGYAEGSSSEGSSEGHPGQWGFHCTLSKRNATHALPVFARNRCVVEVLNLTASRPPPRMYRLSANISHYTHLKQLRVEGVDLRHLEPGSLSALTHLQLLSLSQNALTELGDLAFDGLPELQHLDVSGNHLRSLSSRTFWPLGQLRHLNLSSNHLYGEALPEHMLSHCAALEVLDLSNNPITFVRTALLQHLPDSSSLREFHCRNCGITWFSDRPSPFEGLPSLKVLDLGGNAFHSMSELVIGVIGRLETLRLDHSAIASLGFLTPTISIYSRAYNVLVGTRKYAHVDSTKIIPTVKRFLAEQSEPKARVAPWTKNQHEVNHCEVSNHTNLPLYQEILNNFTAEDYTRDLFNNLTILDLSHNFLTKVIQAEVWTFGRAKELILSYNYLHYLPCAPFYFMNRLEELRLSGNPWKEVRPDYFIGLKALRVVECRNCLLTSFEHFASPLLAHIEELDVGNNLIETIAAEQVTALKQLQKLQLDGNRLKTVSHCVFVYNQNLKIIKLQGNDVDDSVFRDQVECPHRLQQ